MNNQAPAETMVEWLNAILRGENAVISRSPSGEYSVTSSGEKPTIEMKASAYNLLMMAGYGTQTGTVDLTKKLDE